MFSKLPISSKTEKILTKSLDEAITVEEVLEKLDGTHAPESIRNLSLWDIIRNNRVLRIQS